MGKAKQVIEDVADHRDPITGSPESHPVETGMGAAAYGTLGALAGATVGPLGALAGAAIGSAVGGAIGHGAGEKASQHETFARVEPALREQFPARTYAASADYDLYRPAYEYGVSAYERHPLPLGSEELEGHLKQEWEATGHSDRLDYLRARQAIHDAWRAAEIDRPRPSQA
jgi:hypothetical protein